MLIPLRHLSPPLVYPEQWQISRVSGSSVPSIDSKTPRFETLNTWGFCVCLVVAIWGVPPPPLAEVRACNILKFVFSMYRTYEIDDCLLFMLFYTSLLVPMFITLYI
jgi:hypothetical protein